MIRHHPGIDLLTDYAAGTLAESVALVIACHASLCPACRAQVAKLEAVGGALIGELAPAALDDDALARALARIERPDPERAEPAAPALDSETRAVVPAPARRYLDRGLARLKWRWRGPALREAALAVPGAGFRASLFRMKPGASAPRHTHSGHEYTLVLDGGFADGGERYDRGDFALADASRTHVQVADETEGCLCLVVLDAPVRLSGLLGAVANRFLRF
jgi:putative transcriptional regulator